MDWIWNAILGAQVTVLFWQIVETLGDHSLPGEGRSLGMFSIGCMCIFSWNSFSPLLPLLPVHAKLMILPSTSSPTTIFCTERVPESQSHKLNPLNLWTKTNPPQKKKERNPTTTSPTQYVQGRATTMATRKLNCSKSICRPHLHSQEDYCLLSKPNVSSIVHFLISSWLGGLFACPQFIYPPLSYYISIAHI